MDGIFKERDRELEVWEKDDKGRRIRTKRKRDKEDGGWKRKEEKPCSTLLDHESLVVIYLY